MQPKRSTSDANAQCVTTARNDVFHSDVSRQATIVHIRTETVARATRPSHVSLKRDIVMYAVEGGRRIGVRAIVDDVGRISLSASCAATFLGDLLI